MSDIFTITTLATLFPDASGNISGTFTVPHIAPIPSTNLVRAEFRYFTCCGETRVNTEITHKVPATAPLQISPFPGITVSPGGSVSFSATGGDGNYTFSILVNASGGSFTRDPDPPTVEEATQAIIDDVGVLVTAGTLTEKDGKKLTKILNKSLNNLEKGKPAKAVKELNKFVKRVNKLIKNGKLSQTDGQPLTDAANAVIDRLP